MELWVRWGEEQGEYKTDTWYKAGPVEGLRREKEAEKGGAAPS